MNRPRELVIAYAKGVGTTPGEDPLCGSTFSTFSTFGPGSGGAFVGVSTGVLPLLI